ncbi:MAG TPA: hypothetical protein VFM35_08025 [Candidatus Binatia bacterium]|nr:hypothetical protein [Candidatus Binatia bacterium]
MNAASPWFQLFLVAFGSALALLVQYLTNLQSAQTNLALARDQRRFEVGRAAYDKAHDALVLLFNFMLRAIEQPTVHAPDAVDVLNKISKPLLDARIVFGLTTDKVKIALEEAVFDLVRGAEILANESNPAQLNEAIQRVQTLIREQREEFEHAWRRTIEGSGSTRAQGHSVFERIGPTLRDGNVWVAIVIVVLLLFIVLNRRDEARRYDACVLQRGKAECDDIFEYTVPPERRP